MPLSPYSGSVYSGYAVGMPYAGTQSSNYIQNKKADSSGWRNGANKSNVFSRYGASIQEDGDAMKPKEIDTSNIKLSGKSPMNNTNNTTENDKFIHRNRQVVRLTIKEKDKKPIVVAENSVKTIAQKLFEKYTLPDKKKEEPQPYVHKNRLLLQDNIGKTEPRKFTDKPPNLPIPPAAKVLPAKECPKSIVSITPIKTEHPEDKGNEGDDELSEDEAEEDKDAATKCFARATIGATTDKDLIDPEEVKDAIVAAILHPAVDIESDEEIKELINSDSPYESRKNSKKRRKSKEKKIDPSILSKRKKSDAEIGGEAIMDKLKRYVKHQESLKMASRRASADVDLESIGVINVSIPIERIIPIQDESQNVEEKENTDNIKNYNESEKELSHLKSDENGIRKEWENERKAQLPTCPTEGKNEIKSFEEKLSKSLEQAYQTTPERSLNGFTAPPEPSPTVSGEHSITHSENKFPATSCFITDSVSPWTETKTEFLSHSAVKKEGENRTKDLLKEKKLIINDYEPDLEKEGGKSQNESQFHLDNSIKEESSRPKEKEKAKNCDPEESKLNYKSDRETGKEFWPTQIDSTKSCLEEASCVTHSKDGTQPAEGVPGLGCEKGASFSRFNKEEIRVYENDERHHFAGSGMLIKDKSKTELNISGTELEERLNKNDEIGDLTRKNELNLDKSSSRQALAKSKGSFLKSLVSQNSNENDLLSPGKVFDLKKSATTQIFTENSFDFDSNCKSFNDTESLSFNSVQDLEIKPSLRQFLEEAKAEMAENQEKEIANKKESVKNESVKDSFKVPEVKVPEIQEEKPAVKKIKQLPPPPAKEKSPFNELLNARNVLKKPLKPKEEQKVTINKEPAKPVVETKLKKVWKKPVVSKDTNQASDELAKAFNGLQKTAINKITGPKNVLKKPMESKVPDKSSETKETTASIGKLKIPNKNENKDKGSQEDKVEPKKTSPASVKNEKSLGETEKKSTKEKNPLIQTTDSLNTSSGLKKTSLSKISGTNNRKSGSQGDLLVSLSPSQSADSAYGSSPSTPQPRMTAERDGKKAADGKSANTDLTKETSNKEENVTENDEICEFCSTNCHKKCEKQMANLCGVNQKLLAEALSSVKKGISTDGKDTLRILSATSASASKSASSVSSTEGETTTTDEDETETETDSSDYDGMAEVRPPIQTRPKYKKYNLDDFNFIKVLGKGSFGKVMLAQQVNTENYFAVKCLKKDVVLEDNDVDCCLIERKVLTLGTKHPYLCHLFCSFQTPSHLFFVMEYLTGGDLMFHIQHCGRFDEYRSCFYAAEIVSGLKFLHGKGIIYRDLKLDNILLDYEGHIRIADFGMCKLQIYLDRYADTFCGTPDYMAPEVIKGLHYNQCVDWWSFGVLMYEMMIGKSPFKGCDEDHLFWLICNEEPFYPRFLSRDGANLLRKLLEKDATKRIGPPYSPSGEIQSHPFFKYIDWNNIDRKAMEAPYKPRLRHILDVQYFDRTFTKRNAALTPVDDNILASMDQTPFKEFSYTNPNITD